MSATSVVKCWAGTPPNLRKEAKVISTRSGRLKNGLLAAFSDDDFALVFPQLTPVKLPLRFLLEEPNKVIEHVYFLTSGVGILSAVGTRSQEIEVAMLGNEGMSGIAAILCARITPNRNRIGISGAGFQMSTSGLLESMRRSPTLHSLLGGYVQSVAVQTAHTFLAAGHDVLETRLSRWLLMCHDRVNGDKLLVTHEFIAENLGVRRAGVTDALHLLEGNQLIRGSRKSIEIKDRAGLLKKSNGTYGIPEHEYNRIILDTPTSY